MCVVHIARRGSRRSRLVRAVYDIIMFMLHFSVQVPHLYDIMAINNMILLFIKVKILHR